jgi:hypothetical protein
LKLSEAYRLAIGFLNGRVILFDSPELLGKFQPLPLAFARS